MNLIKSFALLLSEKKIRDVLPVEDRAELLMDLLFAAGWYDFEPDVYSQSPEKRKRSEAIDVIKESDIVNKQSEVLLEFYKNVNNSK